MYELILKAKAKCVLEKKRGKRRALHTGKQIFMVHITIKFINKHPRGRNEFLSPMG